jgi:hypothetical protein
MYQQGVFFYGGMNTDDENRLISNGDYRSAMFSRNYGVNAPSEGALQSMTGNLIQSNPNLSAGTNIIIGACEDVEHKALIIFVYNDQDNHSIWRYTVEDSQYELILQDSILNFQKENQIYHAAVVNNLLYWTDNFFNSYTNSQFNPPRKINIQKAILYTQSGGTDPAGYSEITFNNLDWIKHPPLFSPTFTYDSDTTENSNNLKNKLFQFRYQYVYDDNEESAWSPISEMTLPTASEYIGQTVNIDPYVDNTIRLEISTGSSIVRLIRVAYRIGNTGEFFLYKEYDKSQLGWGDYTTDIINFKNETSGPAISNSERNYDLIPQIAKTIEYLPSNEFAIGNYIEGYDKQEITDSDVAFSVERYAIDDTTFAYPLAAFYCDYTGSTNNLYISFNPVADSFTKYRYQEGDVLILQLKDYNPVLGNTVSPDPTIYFTVPLIDPNIYTTDQLKLYALCVELQNYLGTYGILSTVMAASSWNPAVTWPTLKVTDKTWYNRTASQLTQDTNGKIIVLRENKSTRTFKSGAKHEFAFQYYDRANRDGTVLTVPAGEVYVPFNTDLTENQLNGPNGLLKKPYYNRINLLLSSTFQPPMWADAYQILYKPSINISNFQQRSVKEVIFNADSTAKLVLENYYKGNILGASINQTPSKGDFVRFVRERALFNQDVTNLNLFNANANSIVVPSSVSTLPGYSNRYTLNLSSYIVESYDPFSTMLAGVFTAPYTGTFRFDAETTINISYTGVYSPIAYNRITAVVNGTTEYVIGGSVTSSIAISPFVLISNGVADIGLNIGDTVQVICDTYFTSGPANITVTTSNSSYSISGVGADYDASQYYPNYVSKESNLDQELNVLSYDPAGGPAGEEVVVVNNFDPNLLGEYIVFTGTDPNRAICTGGFQIEIYTPKAESENDPWYEVGVEFPIINPHTSTRSHGGDVNQVYGITEGEVYLDCGDVYIRQRVMSTGYEYVGGSANIGDANDNLGAWFCEDPHYSDFYISNWNNKGRLGLYSPFAKQQHLKASIYHTNALIDNTQINGLSRIEFFNNVALKDEHGGINKLIQIGDTLKAFQDKKVTSVYIQKAFALNGDGTNNVILSDKTFAGVRPHDDDYGCIHPGSVSKVENNVFFYDFYNAAVVQATQGGLINICEGERKFSVGIRTFTNNIRNYESTSGELINITSHINRSNGEYALFAGTSINEIPNSVQFENFTLQTPQTIQISGGNYTSIFTAGISFTITNATNSGNNGTFTVTSSTYNAGINRTDVVVSPGFVSIEKPCPGELTITPSVSLSTEGIVYSFNRQRWSSYTSHPVIFATQFGNRAYTTGGQNLLNIGELFEEDKGGSELTFFNQGYTQEIEFLFNSNPTIVKRFLTFTTQSNLPFNVSVTVPATNQYPGGMTSNILIANFRNQESYYVSKYFRDSSDPNPYLTGVLKRLNGRELRGYVLNHVMTNSNTTNKMILFSANVNFVPSEPIMQ